MGYWPESSKSLFDTFVASGNSFEFNLIDDVNDAINECKKSAIRGSIIATLNALFILNYEFEDKEDEWKEIAKKAKKWLISEGIKNPE